MAEIKINIQELERSVARLDQLAANWSAEQKTAPETVGGGKTVNELEDLAQVYQQLYRNLVLLASNTASFLDNVRESYEESDRKAGNGNRGRGGGGGGGGFR